MAAHEATMTVTKGLALTGLRALQDKAFLKAVSTIFLVWESVTDVIALQVKAEFEARTKTSGV